MCSDKFKNTKVTQMVFSKRQFKFLYGTIGNSDPRAPPPPFQTTSPRNPGCHLLNGKRYWLCFSVIQQHLINKTTNYKHFD